MNSTDKKRIEEMLRGRAADTLYRAEDALEHPRPKLPAKIKQRLDAAMANLKPSDAAIDRMEAAIEAADNVGFAVNWTRPRKSEFDWQAAPRQESHPALIAHRQAKIDMTNAVRDARDAAILALWSNDEFNILDYFKQIEASVGG